MTSKSKKYIPLNKGNYSMDTPEREALFEKYRSQGWEKEYERYRRNWEKYPGEQHVSEYPLLVDAELSTLCNLRCPMCYTITQEFKRKNKKGFMDFSLFKKIIDEIAGKVPALRLSLRGEPTLHPRFLDCIRYAKKMGIPEVSFLTNGSLLNEKFAEEVVKAGADWITVSIDGLEKNYEKVRKPLKFREILKRIISIKKIKERLKTHKPVIKIQSVWPAVRGNEEKFYDIFAPCSDLIAFNPLIDYLGKDREVEYIANFSCPQVYQRLVICADGLAVMCANDENMTSVIGNASSQSIHEIWHGEILRNIRKTHKKINGFKDFHACRKCYLPRKTTDEKGMIHGRKFSVKNYINREQEIGS